MEVEVKEFEAWLQDLGTEPIPGGVAAAAVAGAMGAALVAKAARITLRKHKAQNLDPGLLETVQKEANSQRGILLGLADADVQAFGTVLKLRERDARSETGHRARHTAIEVPIRIAEACQSLLGALPPLTEVCWPPIVPDLKTGEWLLETGLRASLFAARGNLGAFGGGPGAQALQARIDALTKTRKDD
jgi:formiminotetrahydrofolate cyclodeaminase